MLYDVTMLIRKFICPAAVLLGLSFPVMTATVKAESLPQEYQAAIESIVARGQQTAGVTFEYKNLPRPDGETVLFEEAREEDYPPLLGYLRLFEEELRKYPRSFFERRELKKVLFVKKLFSRNRPAEGAYEHSLKIIVFDFLRTRGNPLAQRHNIHHELYHMIAVGHPGWQEREWESLNEKSFRYGAQEPRSRLGRNPYNYFAPPVPGFMTDYAMSSAEEDKAEMFACLMTESQHKLLHQWIKKDPVLQRKAENLKTFIRQYNPEMDDAYWAGLFVAPSSP